jgi:peptidoglycan/LPS O-acetylase OafA/YrhL
MKGSNLVPRKLRIILWVTISLIIAAILYIIIMNLVAPIIPTTTYTATYMIFFALIFVCGILIVRWTRQNITQKALKRYLLLAGASALGILFFQVAVHPFNEGGMVMVVLVCPVTLIVGAALALRYKSIPTS